MIILEDRQHYGGEFEGGGGWGLGTIDIHQSKLLVEHTDDDYVVVAGERWHFSKEGCRRGLRKYYGAPSKEKR